MQTKYETLFTIGSNSVNHTFGDMLFTVDKYVVLKTVLEALRKTPLWKGDVATLRKISGQLHKAAKATAPSYMQLAMRTIPSWDGVDRIGKLHITMGCEDQPHLGRAIMKPAMERALGIYKEYEPVHIKQSGSAASDVLWCLAKSPMSVRDENARVTKNLQVFKRVVDNQRSPLFFDIYDFKNLPRIKDTFYLVNHIAIGQDIPRPRIKRVIAGAKGVRPVVVLTSPPDGVTRSLAGTSADPTQPVIKHSPTQVVGQTFVNQVWAQAFTELKLPIF